MRCMARNKRQFYYCLFKGIAPVVDDEDYETGDKLRSYAPPVAMRANVSAASGTAQVEQFGQFISYDKVIITDDMTCPIDEHSVLFIDKAPEFDSDGTPLYDYVVKRVAKSLNSMSIAVSKVSVS